MEPVTRRNLFGTLTISNLTLEKAIAHFKSKYYNRI